MELIKLMEWTRLQRVHVTILFLDRRQYVVDGRVFRRGIFQHVFHNGKLVGREEVSLNHRLIISDDTVDTVWLMDMVVCVFELEKIINESKDRKISKRELRDLRFRL